MFNTSVASRSAFGREKQNATGVLTRVSKFVREDRIFYFSNVDGPNPEFDGRIFVEMNFFAEFVFVQEKLRRVVFLAENGEHKIIVAGRLSSFDSDLIIDVLKRPNFFLDRKQVAKSENEPFSFIFSLKRKKNLDRSQVLHAFCSVGRQDVVRKKKNLTSLVRLDSKLNLRREKSNKKIDSFLSVADRSLSKLRFFSRQKQKSFLERRKIKISLLQFTVVVIVVRLWFQS